MDLACCKTRKAQFLGEMERAASWGTSRALIAPVAPRKDRGRPLFGVEVAPCTHFLQKGGGLSDMAMEEALFDATLIAAPSSIKNSTGTRDPESHQIQKGSQRHFGMKAPIGMDADSGLMHTVAGTSANVHDVPQAHHCVHGEEADVFADAGCQGVDKRTAMCANLGKPEKAQACIRAKVEQPFRVIKRQISRTPVRCRGLAKKAAQIPTLSAQPDLWLARRRLLVEQGVRDPRSTLPWGRNERGGMHRSAQGFEMPVRILPMVFITHRTRPQLILSTLFKSEEATHHKIFIP